ncbi:MAG TPA: YqiA/YcfP family alpha/beta fold hydrolase [Burkholderiaceae bacterium]|nr:YqiA/YcfP family alpha/beta fold hydrolase [Burkholderiaceae bacterium]
MLVYLHGFRSSPSSFKARLLAERMAALGRAAEFACPQLPVSPREAIALVESSFALGPGDTLVGSSLGGCYATRLAERHGCRAVLLNPATRPAAGLARYLGPQTMFHDPSRSFELRAEHLDELREIEVRAITRPERYFLVAATGDELLDWREMVAAYPGARHRVVEGGDHGLSDFAEHLDEVLGFAGVATGR